MSSVSRNIQVWIKMYSFEHQLFPFWILENVDTVIIISTYVTLLYSDLKGNSHLKISGLCDCRGGGWGWHWQTEDVSTASWELWSPHGVVMVWRERVTHEQNQLPLSLRLSRLSPIISPPAHLHWHRPPTTTTTSSQPAATYITLTNQRLRGFFSFCLAFTADIYFSESTVPVSGLKTNTRSQTIHPPFISVSPVVYLNPPVCQCKSASLLTLASLYPFTPPFPPTPLLRYTFFHPPLLCFPS